MTHNYLKDINTVSQQWTYRQRHGRSWSSWYEIVTYVTLFCDHFFILMIFFCFHFAVASPLILASQCCTSCSPPLQVTRGVKHPPVRHLRMRPLSWPGAGPGRTPLAPRREVRCPSDKDPRIGDQ